MKLLQVFCDLPNGARRMFTAYNAYTVVYMLTYCYVAIWLFGVTVVHECRLTLIVWFPWNLNRPRKISSWSIASPCPPIQTEKEERETQRPIQRNMRPRKSNRKRKYPSHSLFISLPSSRLPDFLSFPLCLSISLKPGSQAQPICATLNKWDGMGGRIILLQLLERRQC